MKLKERSWKAKTVKAEDLWSDFEYCLNDGFLYRLGGRYKGQRAGTVKTRGYIQVWFQGAKHYAHRLIWVWLTGNDPGECIDHIDGNTSNNVVNNIRSVTLSINQHNQYRNRHIYETKDSCTQKVQEQNEPSESSEGLV